MLRREAENFTPDEQMARNNSQEILKEARSRIRKAARKESSSGRRPIERRRKGKLDRPARPAGLSTGSSRLR